jgi:hypothetical protein
MKSEATKAISLIGSAAVIALAVGFGGAGANLPSSAPTTTSSNATQGRPADQGRPVGGRASITPTGCIIGLNCGCIPHRTCR